jgi:hypothetical protein
VVAEEVLDDEGAGLLVKRLEGDGHCVVGGSPLRPALDEVRARRAEEQERCVLDGLHEVVDEVEERRLGPVDVVEDDDEGSLCGQVLEELPRTPEELLHRKPSRREPDCRRHALCHILFPLTRQAWTLARASSGSSSSRMPAASRTASTRART